MNDDEQCPHPDVWFDRTLCPEPCGSMHERCTSCNMIMGYCAIEQSHDPAAIEPVRLAVAHAEDVVLHHVRQAIRGRLHNAEPQAVEVWREALAIVDDARDDVGWARWRASAVRMRETTP